MSPTLTELTTLYLKNQIKKAPLEREALEYFIRGSLLKECLFIGCVISVAFLSYCKLKNLFSIHLDIPLYKLQMILKNQMLN
jgi:hypothetical protein